jgi:hypothetical protein
MELESKGICRLCRTVLDEPILEHINKHHQEEFKIYPNALGDVLMRER